MVVRWAAAPRRQRLRPPSKQASLISTSTIRNPSRSPRSLLLFSRQPQAPPKLRRSHCLCALPCAATTRTTTSAAPDYTDASGGVSWRVGRSGRPVVLGPAGRNAGVLRRGSSLAPLLCEAILLARCLRDLPAWPGQWRRVSCNGFCISCRRIPKPACVHAKLVTPEWRWPADVSPLPRPMAAPPPAPCPIPLDAALGGALLGASVPAAQQLRTS